MLTLWVIALAEGAISKFKPADVKAAYESAVKLEDAERCLIDLNGRFALTVYRQPDRPNHVTLLWNAGSGVSVARVDLDRTADGTHVQVWAFDKDAKGCAPAK